MRPSQCLIVTDIDLVTVKHRSVWLDNLYFRLRRTDQSRTPLLVTVDAPGELYLTNVTMQGDSVGPCQALVSRSLALMQGVSPADAVGAQLHNAGAGQTPRAEAICIIAVMSAMQITVLLRQTFWCAGCSL